VARLLAGLLFLLAAPAWGEPVVNVGSKRFTESYILGEIITQSVAASGPARAAHRQGLGNTAILFSALKSGAIDLYPEYTGTVALELLRMARVPDLPQLNWLREWRSGSAIPTPSPCSRQGLPPWASRVFRNFALMADCALRSRRSS
jgi:osmoprotectant transport system permease protein